MTDYLPSLSRYSLTATGIDNALNRAFVKVYGSRYRPLGPDGDRVINRSAVARMRLEGMSVKTIAHVFQCSEGYIGHIVGGGESAKPPA